MANPSTGMISKLTCFRVITVTMVIFGGCGNTEPTEPKPQASGTVTTDRATKVSHSSGSKLPSNKGSSPKSLTIDSGSQPATVEPLIIPEDATYFTPPTVSVKSTGTVETTNDKLPVRLLGFIRQGSDDLDKPQVIIKVGEQVKMFREGERVDDIQLIRVAKRSVTLQRQGIRWSIDLFSQPIVNQASSPVRSPLRQRSTRRHYGSTLPTSRRTSAVSSLPHLSGTNRSSIDQQASPVSPLPATDTELPEAIPLPEPFDPESPIEFDEP